MSTPRYTAASAPALAHGEVTITVRGHIPLTKRNGVRDSTKTAILAAATKPTGQDPNTLAAWQILYDHAGPDLHVVHFTPTTN